MTEDRPPPSEADLVRACADGDRDSWVRFVDSYGGLIASLARRMLQRRTGRACDADVDEVTSGVFLALVKGERRLLRRYRPEFRLSTYLGVICRTEVGKYLRRGGLKPKSLVPYAEGEEGDAGRGTEDPSAENPLAALERKERETAILGVRAALERLAPRDRLLLSLRYIDGLDYVRIADVLRIHPESVGQLLHRAKERLAREVPELRRWVSAATPEPE